jgi:hypothetical protein
VTLTGKSSLTQSSASFTATGSVATSTTAQVVVPSTVAAGKYHCQIKITKQTVPGTDDTGWPQYHPFVLNVRDHA